MPSPTTTSFSITFSAPVSTISGIAPTRSMAWCLTAARPAQPAASPRSGLDSPPLASRPIMGGLRGLRRDRKSTRLNSSHEWISYAVFCLKKKKKEKIYNNKLEKCYEHERYMKVLRNE